MYFLSFILYSHFVLLLIYLFLFIFSVFHVFNFLVVKKFRRQFSVYFSLLFIYFFISVFEKFYDIFLMIEK